MTVSWEHLDGIEKWATDPVRAGREAAEAARVRYEEAGGQELYSLAVNHQHYQELSDKAQGDGNAARAEYYQELADERQEPEELYAELDRLALYRQTHGRGCTPDAAQARHYCKVMRRKVRAELRRRGLPGTRPGDPRAYGPGQAKWQGNGGAR